MSDAANPILYIEELRRFPLIPRRTTAPGTVAVYRTANGRLATFDGGLTAGELFYRGIRVAYEIDTTWHPFDAQFRIQCTAETVSVQVTAEWSVHDPIAVVTNRLTDAAMRCDAQLSSMLLQLATASQAAGAEQLQVAAARLPRSVRLPDGITIRDITVHTRRLPALHRESASVADLLGELLLEGDEVSAPSAVALELAWRDEVALALAGQQAVRADADLPSSEREQIIEAVVEHYARLIGAIGGQFAEPAGDKGDSA